MLIRLRGKAVAYNSILHSNGGFGDHFSFYSFRFQCLYSSISTPDPTHFLVESLGFSKEEATSTSSKVTSWKSLKNPDLVLNFLKQTGLDNTQMKKLVSTAPKLLLSDVSKALKPKFQCLIDLGLSGSDLVNVITRDKTILDRGVVTHLRPTIDFFRRILGSDENVVKALKRFPLLFTYRSHHFMETNVLLLKNYGIPDEKIRKFVLKYPCYFAHSLKRIKGFLHRVEKDFRVPRNAANFLYVFQVLNSQNKSTLDRKFEIFKSFGWSDNEIFEIFTKFPGCIAQSEVKIQKALNLYMNELGFEIAYLVSHPVILAFSVEKRVVPRMQVLNILDQKKIERRNLTLYYVLTFADSKFIDYFVLPYKDQNPDLYEQLKKIVAP